jgi:glycerol-3-phosphate O-acyltransferase
MSSGQKIYQQLLKLPLSLLVKPHSIPSDPVADLELDLARPIVYILPYRSNTDLLTLRSSALASGLPDPLSKNRKTNLFYALSMALKKPGRLLVMVAIV